MNTTPAHLRYCPRSICVWLLIVLASVPFLLRAGEAGESAAGPEPTFGEWLWHTDRLSGDWGGLRTKGEDRGVKFSLYYIQYYAWKSAGGVEPSSKDVFSGSVDFFTQVDFQKLGWIPGGEMLLHVKNNWGLRINESVGALGDPIDDADGDHPIYIDQLYYQQNLFDKKLQLRVGYLDQQTVLDRNAYANSEDVQFMNGYLDNNNAIIPLTIGPGISLFLNPNDWLSFVLGVADANARQYVSNFETTFDSDLKLNGYFETDFRYEHPTPRGPLIGNYRVGLVLDPTDREIYGSGSPSQTSGSNLRFYLSFDQQVYAERNQSNGQGLGLFARYGYKDGKLNFGGNPTEHFWSVGAQYLGLIPHRDHDALGFGFYSAIASSSRREYDPASADLDREDGYEVYYRYQLTPTIALTPGFQYIHQPGTRTTVDDAWVIAFRARFTL